MKKGKEVYKYDKIYNQKGSLTKKGITKAKYAITTFLIIIIILFLFFFAHCFESSGYNIKLIVL